MVRTGMGRRTEAIVGGVFLALMVLFLVLAITTFEGTPTVLLVVGALLFLAVGLFLLAGPGEGSGGGQQQSVVFADGQLLVQGGAAGGPLGAAAATCGRCGRRGASAFCPDCGARMGA